MNSQRKPVWMESISIITSILTFFLILCITLIFIRDGSVSELTLFEIIPNIDIKFKVDALGIIFSLVVSFLWIISSIYSMGYLKAVNSHKQNRFHLLFLLSIFSAIGIAFSANLITMFIFYEILTLVTYPLVTHDQTREALKAGRTYLAYLLSGGVMLLFAIISTYSLSGKIGFEYGGIFNGDHSKSFLTIIFLLFIFGFTKAALMPLHRWLSAAMVAPIPVSGLLHAVAVVKVGVFGITRIVLEVFGLQLMYQLNLGLMLSIVASITIITSSIFALRQDDLKLRLAYSTISQLSYVILGVSLLSRSGIIGGIFHIVSHAFAKITLFLSAGSIYAVTHKKKISELDGIGRTMPFTMLAFSIAAMSMVGLPPFSGFISKWYLAVGSIEAKELAFLFVILFSSILNAAYFFPIIYSAYFKTASDNDISMKSIKEAPAAVVVPFFLTAVITILLFFFSSYFTNLIDIYMKGY